MTSQTLRIVYLIGELGLGGSERQLYLLLKYMDGTRFERHVVVFNPSSNYMLDNDLRQAGVLVHSIPVKCKTIISRILYIFQLLRKVRPHIIHSWSSHDNAYAGVVGTLANVPLQIGSMRGAVNSPNFRRYSPLVRWLILHSVQRQVVNSDAIANELLSVGVPAKRIYVLNNCVELCQSQEHETLDGVPVNSRLIGMVANLRWEKNHLHFIRGLAKIIPEYPDVYGILIGQPLLKSNLNVPDQILTEIAEQGLQGRVLMYGFHANVPKILHSFEIFCLTSTSEGTPNALLEAMSAGLPVIATRVGGIPRIVQDGVTGLLIEPNDVEGLAVALRSLLDEPESARKIGLAGREFVEKEFSCEKITQAFEEYYLNLSSAIH